MTLRILVHPETGDTFKMGRLRPPAVRPRLALSDYRTVQLGIAELAGVPAMANYGVPAAAACLGSPFGNLSAGNCTIAGIWHLLGVFFAAAGQPIPGGLTTAAALALYFQLTGGQDIGLDEVSVLDYWAKNAVVPGTSPITAHADLDATDWEAVTDAAWAFENLYAGLELPEAWCTTGLPKSGTVTIWDVAGDPDPDNGHCISGYGFGAGTDFGLANATTEGALFDTWGYQVLVTRAAVAKYMSTPGQGELHVVLSPDIIMRASQKAPNSYDYARLLSDIEGLA